ncbi:MAG: glycosyltransferase, partial [Anaerolineae bacterium]|nr:glycosyltransferase [Anaerolineae bacterium]
MKICMVTTFYPPHNFGGDGIFVYRLSNALAAQGHEIHVIHDVDAFDALSPKKPEVVYPNHPGITLHSLSSQSLAKVDLLLVHQLGRPALKGRQIKDILESNDFDVIHFHNTSLMGGPQVLSYGSAVKLCTLHECWFVCPMHILWRFDREVCTRRTCFTCTLAGHRPPQLWRYTNHIERSIQHVDAFISPSQFTADIHAANGFSA